MLKSSTIIGGSGANKRRELDFYPTPPDATIALIDFLQIPIFKSDFTPTKILEPCCGDGAISDVLIKRGYTVSSFDIRNTGYGTGNTDYLINKFLGYDAIITNPPFNISDLIIQKSLTEDSSVQTVGMLLKSQYWHAKKRQGIFKDFPPAYVLPLTWRPDFTMGGKGSPTMDMIWTVWKNGEHTTKYVTLLKPTQQ